MLPILLKNMLNSSSIIQKSENISNREVVVNQNAVQLLKSQASELWQILGVSLSNNRASLSWGNPMSDTFGVLTSLEGHPYVLRHPAQWGVVVNRIVVLPSDGDLSNLHHFWPCFSLSHRYLVQDKIWSMKIGPSSSKYDWQ